MTRISLATAIVMSLLPSAYLRASDTHESRATVPANRDKTVNSGNVARPDKEAYLTVPLGFILIDASDVELFNRLARPTDMIAAKPDTLDLLETVTAGRKMLFVGPSHERNADGGWQAMSDEGMSSLMAQARQHGATLFGYNLENGSKGEELINRERQVGLLARAAKLTYNFGPLFVRLMFPGGEAAAREADVVVVQAQAFQRSAGFDVGKVLNVVKRLRSANPNVQVYVQVSFMNRDDGRLLSANEVVTHIKMIAGEVDAVWLFYGPRTADLFRGVFAGLRQTSDASPPPSSSVNHPPTPLSSPAPSSTNVTAFPRQQAGRSGTVQPVPRGIRFSSGSWVPFARLGGQIAGDASPHLSRVLDEAGATEEQRREVRSAYRAGANHAAWQAMTSIFTREQMGGIGRRKPHESSTRHALAFAVEAQTLQRHPDAAERITNMVAAINTHLEKGGVRRSFCVTDIGTYDKTKDTGCVQPRNSGGMSLPADYESHPHDYILVAMDEGAGGANWPCPWVSSVEVHGARDESGGPKDMFTERSAQILCHELGHMLGLPDFYALRIEAEDNPITHQAIPSKDYDPFGGSLMDRLGPLHPWDAEIINREVTAFPVVNHSWIDYQRDSTVLQLLRSDGLPLNNAQVRIYRSNRNDYYRQTLDRTPTWAGTSGADGRMSLGPLVLGTDPFQALRFFLVEIRAGDRSEYRWFSFIEVNFAFWRGEPITIKTAM